jgi:hypothetical protein
MLPKVEAVHGLQHLGEFMVYLHFTVVALCFEDEGSVAMLHVWGSCLHHLWPSTATGDSWGRFFLCMVPLHCHTATHTHLFNTSSFHEIELAPENDGIGHLAQLGEAPTVLAYLWLSIQLLGKLLRLDCLLWCSCLLLLVPVLADQEYARGPADGEGECRGQSCSGH